MYSREGFGYCTALAKLFSIDSINPYELDDVDKNIIVQKKQFIPRIVGYPMSIPIIISHKFCERFSYYGIQYILTIYFAYKLLMD